MKQRIDYIDRMKGMAIFLVVIGHVYGMVFNQGEDITYKWISSFHMPLFMFLSGLVACSGVVAPYWDVRKLGKKLKGLLLPLVVFGICFTMTFSKDFLTSLIGFLESPNKNGYWYLMTLAVFYVSLSLYRLNVKQKWYIDVALAIAIWGGMFALWKYTAQTKDYFCMLNCGNFYPFFILGVMTTKYNFLDKMHKANWLFSLCIVAYAFLFCVDMPFHALVSLNKHIFLPFCMVYIVVNLFVSRHGATSCWENILDFVGKRTLDIYVIHYFFISMIHLKDLGNNWEGTENSLLMFIVAIGLSVVITALSIGVGYILHKGKIIEKIVYGK